MDDTNPTPTQPGETLEPCPLFGHLPDKGEFTNGPYVAVSGAPDMPKFYAVVCPGCCSTAYDENKERVIKKWNTRAAVAGPRGDVERLAAMFTELYNCYTASKCAAAEKGEYDDYQHLKGMAEAYQDAAKRCLLFATNSSPAPAGIPERFITAFRDTAIKAHFGYKHEGAWVKCEWIECEDRRTMIESLASAERTGD